MQFFIYNPSVANAIKAMMAVLGIESYAAFCWQAIKALKDANPITRRMPFDIPKASTRAKISQRATLNCKAPYKLQWQIEDIAAALRIVSNLDLLYAGIKALRQVNPELQAIPFEELLKERGRPVKAHHGLFPTILDDKRYQCPQCLKVMTRQAWHQHGCKKAVKP